MNGTIIFMNRENCTVNKKCRRRINVYTNAWVITAFHLEKIPSFSFFIVRYEVMISNSVFLIFTR